MKKLCFVAFVMSCLLILTLTSCGNLTSRNTGAIVINLPGAGGARDVAQPYNPTDAEKAGGKYDIIISDAATHKSILKRTVTGESSCIVDQLAPGEYNVHVDVNASNAIFTGETGTPVSVKPGSTANAAVSLSWCDRWKDLGNGRFEIARQNTDDTYYDCYLIGMNNIYIKPNEKNPFVNKEHWEGKWPFTMSGSGTFYIGGTYGSGDNTWHDATSNVYQVTLQQGDGALTIPDNTMLSQITQPQVQQGGIVKWSISNYSALDYLGEKWVKIVFWGGESTSNGTCTTSLIFKASSPYYSQLTGSGLYITDAAVDFEGGWSLPEIEQAISSKNNYWFVQCSLIFNPDGDKSIYQIEIPAVVSSANRYRVQ